MCATKFEAYCEACRDLRLCEVRGKAMTGEVKGITVTYEGKVAYCKSCGAEIRPIELDEDNVRLARAAYCEKEGLITPDQIRELQKKYNIALKPLASLLGWGEMTVIRFLNGDIPTRIYSDRLLDLLGDEDLFYLLLEERRDSVTPFVYRKATKSRTGGKTDDFLAVSAEGGDAREDGVKASRGLDFAYDSKGGGYVVAGPGDCKDVRIVIPSAHDGKRVIGIGEKAFCGCEFINSVDVPGSVVSIGAEAFAGCRALLFAKFSSGTEVMGSSAFCHSALALLVLPDSVREIGAGAFGDTRLWKIEIPRSLRTVDFDTFRGCGDLKAVTFRGKIGEIREDAFRDCQGVIEVRYFDEAADWEKAVVGEGNRVLHGAIKIPLGPASEGGEGGDFWI